MTKMDILKTAITSIVSLGIIMAISGAQGEYSAKLSQLSGQGILLHEAAPSTFEFVPGTPIAIENVAHDSAVQQMVIGMLLILLGFGLHALLTIEKDNILRIQKREKHARMWHAITRKNNEVLEMFRIEWR